jgi:putative acetyltransferase
MLKGVLIRRELPEDIGAISHVTELAFRRPDKQPYEQFIIEELRRSNALSLSLVAELNGRVVGHIAFSPVQISDGSLQWYGLGPIAVSPDLQRQGVGRGLTETGLAALQERGAAGCVVLGSPKFYGRFGFKHRPDCILEGVPPLHFQSLTFGEHPADGTVTYHKAFAARN